MQINHFLLFDKIKIIGNLSKLNDDALSTIFSITKIGDIANKLARKAKITIFININFFFNRDKYLINSPFELRNFSVEI